MTKPTHYKVCSISLYTEDIALLKQLVEDEKNRGHSKANKSEVIRKALRLLSAQAYAGVQR